jgi:hypothetical protein
MPESFHDIAGNCLHNRINHIAFNPIVTATGCVIG